MSLINKDRLQLFWNRIKDAYFPKNITTGDTLATETYVNDSINQVSAYYITSDNNGSAFKTKLHLLVATKTGQTYYVSNKRVPTKNDYTLVQHYDNSGNEYCGQATLEYGGNKHVFKFYIDHLELDTVPYNYDNDFIISDILLEGDQVTISFYNENGNNDFYIDDDGHDFDLLPDSSARFVYQKEEVDGKWAFQYELNRTSFTDAQLKALNSNITAEKVEKIDNFPFEQGNGKNCAVQKGGGNNTNGILSFASGSGTTAIGTASHTEGFCTTASTLYSHAEGSSTIASGNASHAEGGSTIASGNTSHAEGSNTIAKGESFHAEGKYNIGYTDGIHEVGIGTFLQRKNAHTITIDGKHYIPNIGGYNGDENNLDDVADLATVINTILGRLGITDFITQTIILPDGIGVTYDNLNKTLTLKNVEIENYNNENKIIKLKTNN